MGVGSTAFKLKVDGVSRRLSRSDRKLPCAQVEAKYGSSFFDAQVLEVTEDGKVKIKWGGSPAHVLWKWG